MASIRYAVISQRDQSEYQVDHLYQHHADAKGCAEAYAAQLHTVALVAELVPPLAVSRRDDLWAVADLSTGTAQLRICGVDGAPGARILSPIRKGMPVQNGVPQFARSGGT